MLTSIGFNNKLFRPFNKTYAVSDDGLILKIKHLKLVTPKIRKDGYLYIGRNNLLHRMVATCWVLKPDSANHVHHINRVKSDNHAINLEWVTPKIHMGERHKGAAGKYERTEETKQKLRNYRLGTKQTEETKQKIREASIRLGIIPPRRPHGYKCSEAAKTKMRLNSPNATPCKINGIKYRSFNEAGAALNEKPHTLRKRCLSSNFDNYQVLKNSILV